MKIGDGESNVNILFLTIKPTMHPSMSNTLETLRMRQKTSTDTHEEVLNYSANQPITQKIQMG